MRPFFADLNQAKSKANYWILVLKIISLSLNSYIALLVID